MEEKMPEHRFSGRKKKKKKKKNWISPKQKYIEFLYNHLYLIYILPSMQDLRPTIHTFSPINS